MTPKLYSILFWPILIVFTHNLVGQDQIQVFEDLSVQFKKDIPNNKVDSLIAICKEDGDIVSMAVIAHRFAIQRRFKGDAIHYALIEVNALQKEGLTDTTFTKALYNLSRFYYDIEDFNEAIAYYERVILQDDIPLRTAQAYAEIGRCYNKLGEFYKSIDYFNKGLPLLEDLKNYRSAANQLMNFAEAYWNIGQKENLDKSMRLLLKADSLGNIYGMTAWNKRNLVNRIANHYISDYYYDFEKARHYYFLNLTSSLEENDSSNLSVALNNLANLYNLEKRDSALHFAQSGLMVVKERKDRARLYDNIAEYNLINNQLEPALENIHKALEVNLGLVLNPKDVPDKFQLSQSASKPHALFCLKKKTQIQIRLYKETGTKEHLINAVQNSLAADELVNMIHEGSSEERSDLLWRKRASEAYFQGAYASSLLQNEQSTFSFMEKNKAILLAKGIARNTALSSLPRALSNREIALKREILKLENSLSKKGTPASKNLLQDTLFNTKRLYQSFLDSLKKEYPDYLKKKLEIAQISLKTAQLSLKKDQVLISFIWNKLDEQNELILGLVTDSFSTKTFQIKYEKRFQSILNRYLALVSEPISTKADRTEFQQVSNALYLEIFPSEAIRALIKNKDLLIIPDGDLQSIPFEALIADKQTNEYLITSGDISYLYSMSFLNYNEGIKRNADNMLIGYSPIDFPGTSLVSLKNAREELNTIDGILAGKVKLEKEASKTHFLENSSGYKIIHLATHASAGENPSISFSDGALSLSELYSYENNADLVTLSACKTSLGAMAKGEGVLSLTRGFFYSGAKSVVASLWNVNDQSTSTIMANFYANLKAGQSKSQALNNAKRNYLKTHSLSEQSPYYWSSFVLIGDDAPIEFSNNFYLYLIAILLVILSIFIYMKKKQKA
ncbi:MAG: CHAT domain-containing protein [Roseivirga sp.]|nr:CHAT domain-containing protein [Roseivirga sp.]